MASPRPSRRARALIAVALAATIAALLGACQPPLTLASLDRQVHQTSLADLARWWTAEQAALHHVSTSTVDRWVASASARLDDQAARSGAWDLSTDLCSFAPDAGPGFDFRWPCIRHDLAWRNLKRLDRQAGGGVDTRARRLRANERFRADLEDSCRARGTLERPACRAVAAAYGRAVDLAA
ncbi:MAG: hypothetical protein KDB04_18630 [Acidimicrobiales bacterium]|nr:hypothetical protein [Acidimicrobiales bacterium]HRW39507.1 phospholipase A2 [Aquihabitans sp.]